MHCLHQNRRKQRNWHPDCLGLLLNAKTKITKWSLFLGTTQGALFNRILSKSVLILFYSSYSFVLFNLPLSGIKYLFSALCAPSISICISLLWPITGPHWYLFPQNYPVHFVVESRDWWLMQLLEYINMTLFQVASEMPVLAASF